MREYFASSLVASGGVSVDADVTVLAQLVMFTGFIVLMKPLIFDPLLRLFEERERRTAGAIAEAREMDEEAINLKRDYDAKFDGIRREASLERERLRGENSKLEAEMMTSARDAVATTLDQGKAKVEDEIGRIRAELADQRQSLAAEIASRVLGREVSK
ncbi:MAG: H(+)-transporting ATPase [Deltaproteobacteria bacterium]|nr:H(+)-transporting ATPase [Deltaproteobacteria bacterium]MBW2536510.1 H(+)-transporting ATPase [Deltaproteobacteria bacterium]